MREVTEALAAEVGGDIVEQVVFGAESIGDCGPLILKQTQSLIISAFRREISTGHSLLSISKLNSFASNIVLSI